MRESKVTEDVQIECSSWRNLTQVMRLRGGSEAVVSPSSDQEAPSRREMERRVSAMLQEQALDDALIQGGMLPAPQERIDALARHKAEQKARRRTKAKAKRAERSERTAEDDAARPPLVRGRARMQIVTEPVVVRPIGKHEDQPERVGGRHREAAERESSDDGSR